jgi:hypothetical protein
MSDDLDPRGLIREAYRIEGITAWDCRSIYLDWALGLASDPAEATRALLDRYAPDAPDHPMTAVLREGVETAARPRDTRPKRRRPETDKG